MKHTLDQAMRITRRSALAIGGGAMLGSAAFAVSRRGTEGPRGAALAEGPGRRSRKRRLQKRNAAGYNVIFISIDDLNDWVSPLGGYPGIITPNLQRLADRGACFTAAMAHVPACSPSRTAVLTGAAAWNTGVYSNTQSWRDAVLPPGSRSIPGHLKRNDWITAGSGKLFHRFDLDLRPIDWSEPYFLPPGWESSAFDLNAFRSQYAQAHQDDDPLIDFGPGDQGGEFDEAVAAWAAGKIGGGWFDGGHRFMGVGFYRPHMPEVVPQRFFDMYPLASVLPPPGYWPGATTYTGNEPDLDDIPNRARSTGTGQLGPILDTFDEHYPFIRSMLAAITFADDNLGKVLDAYDAAGLAENTYIVLFSDHGWQLGEKMKFSKFTLWERALRVPLIVAGPGITPRTVRKPVSLLDIYPTLMSLAGLPTPPQCDGRDLSPLLLDGEPIQDAHALSVVNRQMSGGQGYRFYTSVRTDRYRLTDYEGPLEIYDHDVDPWEHNNLAETADPGLVENLRAKLPASFAEPVPLYEGPWPKKD